MFNLTHLHRVTRDLRSSRIGESDHDTIQVRDLIALRGALPDLHQGGYERVDGPEGWWCYQRGEQTVIAINLTDEAGILSGVNGVVRICTQRAHDGIHLDGTLELAPNDAAIVIVDD